MKLRPKCGVFLSLLMVPGVAVTGQCADTNSTQAADARTDLAPMLCSWLEFQQLPNGLVESAENSNMCSLYDNALAAMVFSVRGDFKRAEGVFDFFQTRLDSEMKVPPGGYGQFRGPNGETLGLPHRWLGDNAWLLIALNNYHHLAGNEKYKEMAAVLEAWIRSLQDKGGTIWGGFETDGKKIGPNAEGMVDSFNAVPGYDDFHKKFLRYFKIQHWQPRDRTIYGASAVPEHRYPLDLQSLGTCAFPGMGTNLLATADLCRTTRRSENGNEVTGFCFDLEHDTVWFEGTAQMVVAYQSAGLDDKANFYLAELGKAAVRSKKNPELYGLPYVSNQGTHFGYQGLWVGAEWNPCVSSAAWYLFGKWKFDPMALGRQKDIPDEHKFWVRKSPPSPAER